MIRDMFNEKNTSKLTQGSIFNYAFDEQYSDYEILGTVISARCDIANSKIDSYCFLPTIPIQIWLKIEIKEIISREHKKSIEQKIKNFLNLYQISENSILIYGHEKTLEVLLTKERSDKKKKQIKDVFAMQDALTKAVDAGRIYDLFKSEIKEIIKKIVENKNPDYYFIDDIKNYGHCLIKLRNVRHLDRKVAEKIRDGIEISEISKEQEHLYSAINIKNKDSLSTIIGSIKSPYIELILQRFSENFTRIGVENHHESIIEIAFERGLK